MNNLEYQLRKVQYPAPNSILFYFIFLFLPKIEIINLINNIILVKIEANQLESMHHEVKFKVQSSQKYIPAAIGVQQ